MARKHLDPDRVFISSTQAADELGCNADRVRKLIESGHLPAIALPGARRHFKIRRSDLDAMIERFRVKPVVVGKPARRNKPENEFV